MLQTWGEKLCMLWALDRDRSPVSWFCGRTRNQIWPDSAGVQRMNAASSSTPHPLSLSTPLSSSSSSFLLLLLSPYLHLFPPPRSCLLLVGDMIKAFDRALSVAISPHHLTLTHAHMHTHIHTETHTIHTHGLPCCQTTGHGSDCWMLFRIGQEPCSVNLT